MTADAQRIAIAKACGWKKGRELGRTHVEAEMYWRDKESCWLPNYHSDLNDMHEAEKVLSSTDCHSGDLSSLTYYESLIGKRSNASQRAEAFLRTIGKWTDD